MQSPSPSRAASPHLPVRLGWLDPHGSSPWAAGPRSEEVIDPDLPIVDTDHHLVNPPETGRYLLYDLLADTAPRVRSMAMGSG